MIIGETIFLYSASVNGSSTSFVSKILITFVMAIGMILTPIYSLSMSRQMFYGYKVLNIPNSYFF